MRTALIILIKESELSEYQMNCLYRLVKMYIEKCRK